MALKVPGVPGKMERMCRWRGSSHRPPLVPVAVLFIGLTAEPFHTHAIWYGMMNALGIFRMDRLIPEELAVYNRQPHYFWLGEVGMASILAGTFAIPAGIYLTGRTGIALAFILAMIVFMPLFRVPAETYPAGDAGELSSNHHCFGCFFGSNP